jgi:beta-1,4-mannosyltransferase
MKVVDMFAAGIPVLAIDFPALPELVKQNVNGFIFKTK